MATVVINKDNFEELVIKGDKVVLLDFYADWCGPCKMIAPTVHAIAEEHEEYLIGKVNVDDDPEIAQAFDIVSIPTLVVMKDGKVVNTAVGVRTKDQILAMLNI
jgi:thioredoxin 1